jgi:sugar phosphate isomerase/epimerase
MTNSERPINRRRFAAMSLAAGAATVIPSPLGAALATPAARDNRYCVFIKFLTSLNYDELAERIAELGFGGVEVTVRESEGYIHPSKAADELPKFKQALDKRGLAIAIVTTDILGADHPHAETVLRASADVGAPRYRLGFCKYDLKKPIVEQINSLRPKFDELAALNRQIGIAGMYQNHAGADFFGSTLWDLFYVLKDHAPEELGCVYDLRHAAVEAGESWPTLHAVMKPHITAYSVKDFVWNGRKSQHAPLGEGLVDPQFYKSLAESDFTGPISLHVEYLKEGDADKQLAAIKRDFAVLRGWMEA